MVRNTSPENMFSILMALVKKRRNDIKRRKEGKMR
jgi:hypothetical protein